MRNGRLAARVVARLRQKGYHLVTAESLTGGMIGSTLTAVPGASEAYRYGYVAYSPEAKRDMLGVDPADIERYGVVSKEVASAMAAGALEAGRGDLSIAVTGVAGPGGGTAEVPVGTVWMASAKRQDGEGRSIISRRVCLRGNRERIRRLTVERALRLVLEHLDS